MKVIIWRKSLSKNEEDVIDAKIMVERGKITYFSINLSCTISEKIYSVARYDLEHGFLHFHKNFSKKKTVVKLEGQIDGKKIKELVSLVEENWVKWKKLFEENFLR